MDPLTHTLVGASLAQTRFGRVRLGTATCVIGANLPDIDAATYFLGGDLALWVRRGWTHGVLAMAVLPPLLAWVMHQVDLVRCRRTPAATPVPVGRLVGLSYVAVLSHSLLDWMNTYGIRLLMPFDGRWFYGDALFIVDPWIWLLLGTVAVLAYSDSRLQVGRCITIGLVATILVTGVPGVGVVLRVLWCGGIAGIVGLRVWGGWQSHLQKVATVCLVLAGLYVAAMVGSSRLARGQVDQWARSRGFEPRQIMVGPAPGDPFRRDVVVADDRHYHRLTFDWLAAERVQSRGGGTSIGNDHPAAAAALAATDRSGFANWTRFPSFTTEPLDDGYRVTITDIRFGGAVVTLDRDLELRSAQRP